MLGLVALPCLGGRRHPHRSLLGAGGRGEGWQVEGASGVATEPHSPGRAAGGRGGGGDRWLQDCAQPTRGFRVHGTETLVTRTL